METKPPYLLYIQVVFPAVVNSQDLLNHSQWSQLFMECNIHCRDFERLFFGDPSKGIFTKIGEGAFIVEEDAFYPNIMALMRWCDDKKFPYVIVPIGDSATTFSRGVESACDWLRTEGKRSRLSR
jgi:hypothetical protein